MTDLAADTPSVAPDAGGAPIERDGELMPSSPGTPHLPSATSRVAARHPVVFGIQRRIMLYVVVGLGLMFAVLLPIGMRSLDEATTLVFRERLTLVRSIGLVIERDLAHVTEDVGRTVIESSDDAAVARGITETLGHLSDDSFAFFSTSSIWAIDTSGRIVATAAISPQIDLPAVGTILSDEIRRSILDGRSVLTRVIDDDSFASLVTSTGGEQGMWLVVNLTAYNSLQEYDPGAPGGEEPSRSDVYHLEVTDPEGMVVLGIGPDETPGSLSVHSTILGDLRPIEAPIVIRHLAKTAGDPPDHVMAIAPIADTGLVIGLEQPIDIALALPRKLKRELLLWSSVGITAALLLAWFTTRSVARPASLLTSAARRMEQGDLTTPIGVAAKDEIGLLAQSLESMRHQIQEASAEVEEINRVLEQRVRERTEHLGVLTGKVISAQEDERHRLARELHDETAQTIGALSIAIDRARDDLVAQGVASTEHLGRAKEIASSLLRDIRRLIRDLRPMVLDDMGLEPAVRWYLETQLEQTGVRTAFEFSVSNDRLPAEIESYLFRIIQEATTNIVRHAAAQHAMVRLEADEAIVRLVVSDDGRGLLEGTAPHFNPANPHLGLLGIRERVSLLGGRIHIESAPGAGTRIEVEIPLLSS